VPTLVVDGKEKVWALRIWTQISVILTLTAIAIRPVGAEVRSITWDDLLPPRYMASVGEGNSLVARINELPADARDAFQKILAQLTLQKKLGEGAITAEGLVSDSDDLLKTDYRRRYPDAAVLADEFAALRAEVETLIKTPNKGLDGKTVRMSGYVLPLEFDGTETVEFLLVPYVGACVHVPPPPPNQMVYVKFPPGFETEGLFAPVYVTGRMATIGSTVDLFLSDGEMPVETGYRMEATIIEPFTE
jgi:hypothetical protein